MDKKIWIALITSAGSIIIAIIGLVYARRNEVKLQLLKYELESKRNKTRLAQEHLQNRINSIDDLSSSIQEIKDTLLFILRSLENTFRTQNAIKMLEKGRKNILESYKNKSVNLTEKELDVAHDAKNLTIEIENQLKIILDKTDYVKLNENEKIQIQKMRDNLTEYQNTLRDLKVSIITEIP